MFSEPKLCKNPVVSDQISKEPKATELLVALRNSASFNGVRLFSPKFALGVSESRNTRIDRLICCTSDRLLDLSDFQMHLNNGNKTATD
jgi:hypothetical protein